MSTAKYQCDKTRRIIFLILIRVVITQTQRVFFKYVFIHKYLC